MFEKLDMKTINFTDENIKKLAEIFPNVVSEDENGKVIDFEALKQELSGNIVEGYKERYSLNWPSKREAQLKANTPTTKTLRPCIEDSVNFDTTENLYIEGDNLEVLKILQEGYLNKIKMIYIDPPYNTGKDFVYKDNFTRDSEEELLESGQIDEEGGKLVANPETNGRYHSDWLSMMYSRLKLARNLLKDDGIIFISLDDNEIHNLRKICDEIFGEKNYISEIVLYSNPRGRQSNKFFPTSHEYILAYAKNSSILNIYGLDLTEEQRQEYSLRDEFGVYREIGLRLRGGRATAAESPTLHFPLYYNENTKLLFTEFVEDSIEIIPKFSDGTLGTWRWSKDKIKKSINELKVRKVNGSDGERYDVFQKDYLNEDKRRKSKSLWLEKEINYDRSKDDLKNVGLDKVFDYSKPVYLLKKLNIITTKNDDIILDFFSGSSTTAEAIIKLNSEDNGNRKFIMVQLVEETDKKSEAYKAGYKNICEIGKERIRRAGKNIVEETGKTGLDIGFRVLKLDSSNMKDIYFNPSEISQQNLFDTIDNIKEDRTDLDLLFGVMIDWGVDLTLPIKKEVIQGKDCYFVDSDSLCAYFGNDINEEFIKELAKKEALRFVFKDSSFGNNDDLKDNVSQIFKQLNPQAEIKVI